MCPKPSKAGARIIAVPTALIYTRVSKDEQARDGLSLPAQVADTRRYVASLGWELGSEYQDVLSGRRDDRPQYQSLLADVRWLRAQGRPVAVVVKWLDRLGRNVLERSRCARELRELGVPIHSVMEGGMVSDFVYNILAAVAEEESRRVSERTADSRQFMIRNGWATPGRTAFGYRRRPATDEERREGSPRSVLEVDPERAPYYREACEMVISGRSSSQVSRWLQSLPVDLRQGRGFDRTAVEEMLRAAVYVARPEHGEPDVLKRPVARWPALVDDETWRRMRQTFAEHTHMPRQASQRYLLTGLLRCSCCGSRMQGGNWWSCTQRRHLPRYKCHSDTQDELGRRVSCWKTALGSAVDQAVLQEVGSLLDTVVAGTRGRADLKQAWRRATEPRESPQSDPRLLELVLVADQAKERLKKAALKLVDGELDREAYESVRDQARRDLDGAEAELSRVGVPTIALRLPELEEVLEMAGSWRHVIARGEVADKRAVLGQLIDHVVPTRLKYRTYRIDINWAPLGDALRSLTALLTAGQLARLEVR